MVAHASGLGMGVGRFSKPQKGVGVIAMLKAELDTTQHVAVPPGAAVLPMLVTGVALRVLIDRRCVADGVEVTRWVITAP